MVHKRRHTRKHRKGGSGAASPSTYSDSASYMLKTVGNGNTQWNNVFSQGKGSSSGFPGESNSIKGLQGQQAGGSRKRKGGFWSQIINQAIVPFSIFGMQQSFRRSKRGGNKTRKHKKH